MQAEFQRAKLMRDRRLLSCVAADAPGGARSAEDAFAQFDLAGIGDQWQTVWKPKHPKLQALKQQVETIQRINVVTGKAEEELERVSISAAKHFVMPDEKVIIASMHVGNSDPVFGKLSFFFEFLNSG